ncbi:MAG: carbon monoxide dehydrogenase, partial [Gemmatimonadetes bacterium]|nr:carbon monoxide dehydrogenase [Gemmatimonadota bacterium]NIR80585.1 carbon monoxide dehydrogenase [Gemmatimonadota bacterium]NIT89347.1 carbon monoxide dehydrogenase [Gemmatimonadota bacterium]NIU33156.1 carbon monoxide dehydrogenase [Gemmatimonadota bacterium]NIU37512.1 carbon monoxide dehydrogenase [Gemmatimonadota bacterium]
AARVWAYLIDPERVAPCLPGARLTEVRDENTFLGEMTVKVGPVKASYQGEVELVEADDAERRVKMTGKGMEKSGGGSARMTMVSRVTPLPA